MNDPKITASALKSLIDELPKSASLADKAAIFSAIRLLCDDFVNAEDSQINGYAKEKAEQIRRHSAAALGFDTDNGHTFNDHFCWCLGAFNSLKGSLQDLSQGIKMEHLKEKEACEMLGISSSIFNSIRTWRDRSPTGGKRGGFQTQVTIWPISPQDMACRELQIPEFPKPSSNENGISVWDLKVINEWYESNGSLIEQLKKEIK
ncbi:hypothetical protein [Azomonas macrocytogenes]|uniref:Putative DNA-binding transcriptional regulator AlpA n=1 Tax=Azomonas macrocytogenes TaxID=69962 RepID=A0A839T4U3_AZOMA|nr:hypothetical protein [Azomonas macrocytogenes]MBB3103780.1 putative DNA-binding transcriptional regulator AlpA [Azomonas macrocytogenes]